MYNKRIEQEEQFPEQGSRVVQLLKIGFLIFETL